ncbi:MAG: HD domain-containing protein, partial [Desulfomonilaceae bacterium]
ILSCEQSTQVVEQMAKSSLFWEMFPELLPTRGFEQNAFHHLDVWGHTVEALENFESLVRKVETVFGPFSDKIKDYIFEEVVLGRPRIWLLKLAILFHDSGKPFSLSVDEKGRRRFIGHEKISMSLIMEVGSRLKLASRELSEVSSWVAGHMRPSILTIENLSDRAMLRLRQKSGIHFVGLILLYLADISASRGNTRKPEEFTRARMAAKKAIEMAFREDEEPVKPLLDGVQLMEEFNLEQGPRIGTIMRWLVTEQALGTIRDQEQARQAIRRYLDQHPSSK